VFPPFDDLNLKEAYTETATQVAKQDLLMRLLSVFTNNLFFRYTDLEGNWGIPMLEFSSEEELNGFTSVWCYPLFSFPGFSKQMKIEDFTALTEPQILKTKHKEYYMHYPNLDFDSNKALILPDTIDNLFEAYFKLDNERKKLIDAAMFYSTSASELHNSKRTLSLLASFTAVETMVNIEYKDHVVEVCPECKQPKFSVAKKFREFLLKYLGNSAENKKKFNKYYTLRSKIVHTGKPLRTDSLFSEISDNERQEENLSRIEILQMGRMAIVNWLLLK
jgi:hypothetical protein